MVSYLSLLTVDFIWFETVTNFKDSTLYYHHFQVFLPATVKRAFKT